MRFLMNLDEYVQYLNDYLDEAYHVARKIEGRGYTQHTINATITALDMVHEEHRRLTGINFPRVWIQVNTRGEYQIRVTP